MQKLNLRLSDELHAQVKDHAVETGLSMNGYIVALLELSLLGHPPVGDQAVTGSALDMSEGDAPVTPRQTDLEGGLPVGREPVPVRGDETCDHQPYAQMGRSFCYRCGARI